MNNKNKKSNLQFTKLTPDDVVAYEDDYIELLMTYSSTEIKQQNGLIPAYAYYDYAAKELQKAKEMFCKAFE